MTFSHDVEHSLNIVVDLVNTDPISGGGEQLGDLRALGVFVDGHQISDVETMSESDLGRFGVAIQPRAQRAGAGRG